MEICSTKFALQSGCCNKETPADNRAKLQFQNRVLCAQCAHITHAPRWPARNIRKYARKQEGPG